MSGQQSRKNNRAPKSRLFTDRYIKSLKPEEKMYQVREARGFAVRVLPSGVKTWYYVYQLYGRRRQLNLGNYPDTTLEAAHKAYRNAYEMVKKGLDPQSPPPWGDGKTTDLKPLSIADLSSKYLEHIGGYLVPLSVVQISRILDKDILPVIGEVLACDLRRHDAIQLVEKVALRTPGQARNIIKTARAMFSYALERDLIDQNPFSRIGRAVPSTAPRARMRSLSEKEIASIWFPLVKSFIGRAILLVLITGQRPGEVVGMKWREIEDGWWNIPGERTKNRRENRVYLSYLAKSLLPGRIEREEFVFPAQGRGRGIGAIGSMRPGTLSHFLTDNEYFNLPRWTPHDLRRTIATELARLGCPDEIIDELLNHKKKGVISVYNQYRYDNEKKVWLKIWSKKIIKIIKSKKN